MTDRRARPSGGGLTGEHQMAAAVGDILLNRHPFVPILTVMADYGSAPFLWCVEAPQQAGIGANLCDGTWWDEAVPMTEGLWQKFSD